MRGGSNWTHQRSDAVREDLMTRSFAENHSRQAVHAAVPPRDIFVTTFITDAVEEGQKSGEVTVRWTCPRQLTRLLRLRCTPRPSIPPVSVLERFRHLQRDPATVRDVMPVRPRPLADRGGLLPALPLAAGRALRPG